MKKFYKKWNLKSVDDCGSCMSESAKQFCRDFKSYLKRSFPNAKLINFTPNHYDISGFLIENDVCVYISYKIPRYGESIDFNANNLMNSVLYRTAKHTKDFSGGNNNFSSLFELEQNLKNMLEKTTKEEELEVA